MAKSESKYEFSFVYDGDDTFENILKALIVDRIARKKEEKHLHISNEQDYNVNGIPVQSVPGSCKVNT